MKKSILKRLAIGLSALCLGLTVAMVAPAASVPVQAAMPETSDTNKEAIGWIFLESEGKLYKRLFNHSTGHWIGDWIYVRDL